MLALTALFALLPLLPHIYAAPLDDSESLAKRCTFDIKTYADVPKAISSKCATINLGAITVPSGKALDLGSLPKGAVVTVTGDVTFTGGTEWEGPMFIIGGESVTFNGNGKTFNGQGEKYWDGQGGNGGKTKPQMMKLKHSGTFSNLIVKNSPRHVFSIGNKAPLKITGVTIDNKAGDKLGSDGKSLGHNSDCFDVSANDVTLDKNTCYNQDDCLAINKGSNIVFSNNYCSGGHGISIGSIKADTTVSKVQITGNTVVKSDNGLRIKIVSGAKNSFVSDITYTNNVITGATKNAIVIHQDYLNGGPTGTPTNGVTISNINFKSGNTASASGTKAKQVYVLCGSGSCKGTWNWSGLKTSGGIKGSITGKPPITGFTL